MLLAQLNWPGSDVFGVGTFERPWLDVHADPMDAAFAKQDAAFEFFAKLGVPFSCFHDADMAPAGATLKDAGQPRRARRPGRREDGGDRRSPAVGNRQPVLAPPLRRARRPTPIPTCSPTPPPRSRDALEATHRLGGANYVLWGGREGYETLLNTDMKHEADQLARFLTMVVEHKRKIGFTGTLLIEPKPQEPTKHQYDYDSATVHGFSHATGWRAS